MSDRSEPHVLIGVHELGILDHATALASQLLGAGARVSFSDAGIDTRRVPVADLRHRVRLRCGANAFVYEEIAEPGVQFDASLVQTPYDEQRSDVWRRAGREDGLSYAGYGLAISNWTRGHFDLPFFDRCHRLLVSSPESVAQHISHGVSNEHVRHTGDALLYETRARVHAEQHRSLAPVILWMPHWTMDWFGDPGYSNWSVAVFDVLDTAKTMGVSIVLRPHPLLADTLDRSDDSPPSRALRELLELPNVSMSSTDLVSDLLHSTAVLTDGVSVISYAAASGLPVGVCRRQDSPPFGENGAAIVACCDQLFGPDQWRGWLHGQAQVIRPRDPHSRAASEVHARFPLRDQSPGALFAGWIDETTVRPLL